MVAPRDVDEAGRPLFFVGDTLELSWADALLLTNNPLFLWKCPIPSGDVVGGGGGGEDADPFTPTTTKGGLACRLNELCHEVDRSRHIVFPNTGSWEIADLDEGTGSMVLCLEG